MFNTTQNLCANWKAFLRLKASNQCPPKSGPPEFRALLGARQATQLLEQAKHVLVVLKEK